MIGPCGSGGSSFRGQGSGIETTLHFLTHSFNDDCKLYLYLWLVDQVLPLSWVQRTSLSYPVVLHLQHDLLISTGFGSGGIGGLGPLTN